MSSQPTPTNEGEHLFLEVELNHKKILLGVYYSPSLRIDFFSSFETLLENFTPSYTETIIMGDFNTCLLKNDSRSDSFRSSVESQNLSFLPLNSTHHLPNCNPSLLDLILVSSPERVAKHGQYSADSFSYHDLIFLSYKIRPPKVKPTILLQRNFSGIVTKKLRKDAAEIEWSKIIESNDLDEKVDIFNKQIVNLYDVHAPLRPIKLKHLPAPWLTKNIKLLLAKKSFAKTKYKRRPTSENWDKYISIRNHCNKVCRDAQRRHIHESVENGDPARIWKFLKTLGIGKSKNSTTANNLDIESLNKHFSSSSHIDKTTKQKTLNYLSSLPTPTSAPFVFSEFTGCDVKKSLTAITSKAVGSDSVSRNMILPILDLILPTITHILNFSVSTGSFPCIWKEALIVPIPKKSNPKFFSEYRPISILPFLSKVLERLIHDQISIFLNTNFLLNPFQSGFRPGHSTVTALVKITDDIRFAMDKGKVTILTLLDFSNAFNTVEFDILLSILSSLNISPTVIEWFRNYLLGRRQRIRVEESFSSWCNTSAGVPQGGVLSPLLFAVFINSISKKLQSSYHLYADDLQIYNHSPIESIDNSVQMTNEDLRVISEWSEAHGLKVNPSKTQTIVVGSSRMISRINWTAVPKVVFDGVDIEFNSQVRDLGILIDNSMSWGPQVKEVSRKLFASAASLRRLRNFLPHATRIALVQSLLLPILDYADASYLDLNEFQLNKLERLQNFCIRFIFGLRKYDHISEFRAKLKWLPIRLRRNAHVLSLLYNILFNPKTPHYLKDAFKFVADCQSKSLRLTLNLRLRTPIHSTKFYNKSFIVQAVRLWNELPIHIKQAQSAQSFNKLVKDHYLRT